MEKKAIGSFIAALRKANGMTQQQLADRLNVSNKAVSRWENEESLPDLALIPVIAEIFGITTDELLTGQRKVYEETENNQQKIEKQIKRILDSNITKFKALSYISLLITLISLIAMLTIGYAFYKAILGFGVAIALIIISLILEVIFTTYTVAAINNDEWDNQCIYRLTLIKYLKVVIYANVYAIILCIPFVVLQVDTYTNMILTFNSWIQIVPICAFIAFIINLIISFILSKTLMKCKAFLINQNANDKMRLSAKLRSRYILVTAIIMTLTLLIQSTIIYSESVYLWAKGKTFYNFKDFNEYMKASDTDTSADNITYSNEGIVYHLIDPMITGQPVYIIFHGTRCGYFNNRQNIGLVSSLHSLAKGEIIKVFTNEEVKSIDNIKNLVNSGFLILYSAELSLGIILYYNKRRKSYIKH